MVESKRAINNDTLQTPETRFKERQQTDLLQLQLILVEMLPRRDVLGRRQHRLDSANDGRLRIFKARPRHNSRYCQLDVDDQQRRLVTARRIGVRT